MGCWFWDYLPNALRLGSGEIPPTGEGGPAAMTSFPKITVKVLQTDPALNK